MTAKNKPFKTSAATKCHTGVIFGQKDERCPNTAAQWPRFELSGCCWHFQQAKKRLSRKAIAGQIIARSLMPAQDMKKQSTFSMPHATPVMSKSPDSNDPPRRMKRAG
eukprot:1019051-Pelagomonas_calceolata.AAC.11